MELTATVAAAKLISIAAFGSVAPAPFVKRSVALRISGYFVAGKSMKPPYRRCMSRRARENYRRAYKDLGLRERS